MVEEKVVDEVAWFRDVFSGEHRYLMEVNSLESASLRVEQQEKFKSYELAAFELEMGSEEMVRESLMYRYERMKLREKMLDR